jgi:uncharacterized protein (UPF0261 family)
MTDTEIVTVCIQSDERYPDYSAARVRQVHSEYVSAFAAVVDVDAKTLARWQRAEAAYMKYQEELAGLLEMAGTRGMTVTTTVVTR